VIIRLKKQAIEVSAARELCFEVIAAGGKVIEKRSPNHMIVEFTTEARGRQVRTVEDVVLDRPKSISYSWISGPLAQVEELIELDEVTVGRTRVTYQGSFASPPGPLGWLGGHLIVRPAFYRSVREHLAKAKDVAERRARRSHVYPTRPNS
jgi:hypothetical protein